MAAGERGGDGFVRGKTDEALVGARSTQPVSFSLPYFSAPLAVSSVGAACWTRWRHGRIGPIAVPPPPFRPRSFPRGARKGRSAITADNRCGRLVLAALPFRWCDPCEGSSAFLVGIQCNQTPWKCEYFSQ